MSDLKRRTIQIEVLSHWDDPTDWIWDLIESKLDESIGEEVAGFCIWNTVERGES